MKLGTPKEQNEWLGQHIPHRIRASLAMSQVLERMLEAQMSDPEKRRLKTQFCLEMAAWEGRHAAIRWLIEFVGVTGDDSGKAVESPRRRNRKRGGKNQRPHDVDIMDLPGGDYFPLGSKDADLLGQVWKGASQATGHATAASKHPSLARDRLSKAALIVTNHLEATVYKAAGLSVQF